MYISSVVSEVGPKSLDQIVWIKIVWPKRIGCTFNPWNPPADTGIVNHNTFAILVRFLEVPIP